MKIATCFSIFSITSAIAAYGAFFIPKSFSLSIDMTGGANGALWCFLAFYLSCLLLAWFAYARPGGILYATERGLRPQFANQRPTA